MLAVFFGNLNLSSNWRTASRESANLAPLASKYKEAVVQVYAARAFGWRGLFAVHTWIVSKDKNANSYTVYQIIGWRNFFGLSPLSIQQDIPDRMWFGQKPQVLKDIRGVAAENISAKLNVIAHSYPWQKHYILFPGPNSNTFIAYLARKIPELHLSMLPIAIGKDYLGLWKFYDSTPSISGYQISWCGLLGLLIAKDEGMEINILGMVFGINFKKHKIILPGIGYI